MKENIIDLVLKVFKSKINLEDIKTILFVKLKINNP